MGKEQFTSYFKLNNKVLMPPVITLELKKEIELIREICKVKEEKMKLQKDKLNQAKKEEEMRSNSRCSSGNSYTISNPIFSEDVLPKIEPKTSNETSFEDTEEEKTESSDKETIIDGSLTMQSETIEDDSEQHDDYDDEPEQQQNEKDFKDAKNEVDKRSSPNVNDNFQPELKIALRQLIERQKLEYLNAMNVLKRKFTSEQNQLLAKLQSTIQQSLATSTPLSHNSFAVETEDEEFAEFETCLQNSNNAEKTLVNESDLRERAATKINSYVRGYFVRRLMATFYVQKHINNIKETLKFILNLSDYPSESPAATEQDIVLKTKLFKRLQTDLYHFSDIFNKYSIEKKMKLIANDRHIRRQNIVMKSKALLNCSIQTV